MSDWSDWKNKASWPRGPWDDEPDEAFWTDAATGFPCQARRGPLGQWNGYVGVSPGHRFYDTESDELCDLEVHGGVTFSGTWSDDDLFHWIGFDCAHAGDVCPGMLVLDPSMYGEYRTLDYVRCECGRLASQLGAVDTRWMAKMEKEAIEWLSRTRSELRDDS